MPLAVTGMDMGIIVLYPANFRVGAEGLVLAMSLAGKLNWQSRLNFKDDAELAERLKRREPEAMADLYDRYGRATYSLIFRIVRDTSVAEDLVQETFLRIWNRVRAFDAERGALGSWMLTVARNRALDYVRSVDGRMAQNASQLEEMENPSAFADIEQDILNIDRIRLLRDAFTKLNPKQREVIEMAYYEGLSQSEMAERMQQPLGTVKAWARSALKVLRDQLGQVTP
jgi:RNA polymerase sigma-70 factor (ECF subfamily)